MSEQNNLFYSVFSIKTLSLYDVSFKGILMRARKILIVPLIISFLYGYKVDSFSSGVALDKIRLESTYQNNKSNPAYFYAATTSSPIATKYTYSKRFLGERASITHYFTRKSRKLYKTEVLWGMLSGAFKGVFGIDEKEKREFSKKLKKFLSEKYKIGSKKKSNVFIVDSYSIVELSEGTTGVKLVYIDTRFSDKAKKEESIYQLEKNKKEYQKANKGL